MSQPVGTNLPSLIVQVDFTDNPTVGLPSGNWTDITHDVRALTYTRSGRSDVLQQTSTGTLSMTLNNRSGNYDPLNASGAYYPNVKRMRWLRVQAVWSGVTYNRWQGLVNAWNPSWPDGNDAIVQVTASDALKVLSLFDLGGLSLMAERTHQRVVDVCNNATAGLAVSYSTGASDVVSTGTISVGTSGLSHLQSVEQSENGRLFADAGGTIVFQDRHWRIRNSQTSMGTIGDVAGEIPYLAPMLAYDDTNIWTDATVTTTVDPAVGGTAVSETWGDTTTEAEYFTRSLAYTYLIPSVVDGSGLGGPTEALAAAQYLVKLFKDPTPKLPAITLLPARNTSFWPVVLGAANSQRFTFRRRPQYGGTIQMDGFVEQVSDTIVPGQSWDVSLQLASGQDQAFWLLGDATYGLLGQTTYLTY